MRRWITAFLLSLSLAFPAKAAWLRTQGRIVHYEVSGTGRTIIFVHGWTCNETSWSRQFSVFARRYRVVALDLPGHGRSESPEGGDYSMRSLASAVEAVRAAIHEARVVLVGHSMGAGVIRRYALDHPEHVAGLVAVDGPLDIRPFAGRPANQPPLTLAARRRMIDGMFVPETPPQVRRRVIQMMLGTSEITAVGASGAMFNPVNQSDQLIEAPALTIYAGKPLFPINPATKEVVPRWQWTQIAGTGHFVMLEKPNAFNRLLADFVRKRATY